jgi:hypothetical protein
MQGRYANIFESFRKKEEREAGELGTALEEDVTKALLHLIDHGDSEIIKAIVETLAGGTTHQAALVDLASPETVETYIEVPIKKYDERIENGLMDRELILVGVSDSGDDPTEVDPEGAKSEQGEDAEVSDARPDAVILIGDSYAIIEESKFNGSELGLSDTEKYRKTLNIPEESYHTVAWLDIFSSLEDVAGEVERLPVAHTESSEELLARQFMGFIKRRGLKVSSFKSTYNPTKKDRPGVKYIKLNFNPDLDYVTPYAESETPDYAIQFEVHNTNHQSPQLTQGELEELNKRLDNLNAPVDVRSKLSSGTFDPKAFKPYMNGSRKKLVTLGNPEDDQKILQISSGGKTIGLKHSSAGSDEADSGRSGFFMLSHQEIKEQFRSDNDNGGNEIAEALFGENPDILRLR